MRQAEPLLRHAIQGDSSVPHFTPRHALLGACCGLLVVLASGAQASTLEAINHTHWAINRFSVDGRSGIDIIGPYQGGRLLLYRAITLATRYDCAG